MKPDWKFLIAKFIFSYKEMLLQFKIPVLAAIAYFANQTMLTSLCILRELAVRLQS